MAYGGNAVSDLEQGLRTIGFRVDVAEHIGTGHLQRCLTLATTLNELGWHCIFFGRGYSDNIFSTIKISFEYHVIGKSSANLNKSDHFEWLGVPQEQDAIEMLSAMKSHQLDVMIVDHYSIDYHWEKYIEEKGNVMVMVIDDLANRIHCCTLLIDQNFWPNSYSRYDELVPLYCKKLLGPKFTMLRKDFISLRVLPQETSQVETILVNFGGIGNMKIWKLFLPVLVECHKYNFHIITGKLSSEDFQLCKTLIKQSKHIFLEEQTNQMSYLMKNSDFALGACGSTVWERFCLGMNAALIDVADNQKDLVSYLHEQNLIDYLGSLEDITVESISNYLTHLSINSSKYQKRRKDIMQLVDGMGADRVANEIISTYERRRLTMVNDTILLVPVSSDDLDYLYDLQCIEGIREFALNANTPTYEEHIKWFNDKLNDSRTKFFKVMDDNCTIGVVRLDFLSEEGKKIAEISLTIDSKYSGKGYAKRSIGKIVTDTDTNMFHAVIHKMNIASQKVFITNGFKYDSLYLPNFDLYTYCKD